MDKVFLESIISFLVATPIALIVMRFLFKSSIFYKITFWWVMTLLFVASNTRISTGRPDLYPYHISMPVAIIVISIVAYINNAIQDINTSTQQNATNAEEMAGSAVSMAEESAKLNQLIGYFILKK